MFTNFFHLTAKLNHLLGKAKGSRVYVGKMAEKSQTKVLWKNHESFLPDIDRLYLLNEIQVLSDLQKMTPWQGKKFTIQLPLIASQTITKHQVSFATYLFEGKKLADSPTEKMLPILTDILGYLTHLNRTPLLSVRPLLGRRSTFSLFTTGLMYGCQATLKNPQLAGRCLAATIKFALTYLPFLFRHQILGVVHRDLDPDNIMIAGKKVLLADWENVVISDQLFDLAQIPRLYGRFVGLEAATAFCVKYLDTKADRQRWYALALYGSLQALAIKPKQTHMYQSAKNSLSALVPQKSFYEHLFFAVFGGVSQLRIHWPAGFKKMNRGIVLCYHNVGHDGWRFTTSPQEFEAQLIFLSKHFTIKSLAAVIKDQSGIAITFDDGYQGVYEFALPILRKYHLTATVFVVGDRQKINRAEIDNSLPLLTDLQIKELAKAGWEIGYHTETHPDLMQLETSELMTELVTSKVASEKRLKLTHRYFAYPRGSYNPAILNNIKAAEYEAAFTINGGALTHRQPASLLNRVPIERGMTGPILESLLTRPGNVIYRLLLASLRWKSQQLPKLSRALGWLLLVLFCGTILAVSIRGLKGNPTTTELNTPKWMDNGPLELSPERGRFALTYSLIENHSFHFTIPLAQFALPDVATARGYFVSIFAPTVSYLAMPGYIVGKAFGVSQVGAFSTIALFALLNLLLLRAIAIKLGAKPAAATIAGLLFLFATPAFPYAVTLYQHHISTFLILLSIYTLLYFKNRWSLAVVWFCCALSISVDNPNLFLMFPVGVFALSRTVQMLPFTGSLTAKLSKKMAKTVTMPQLKLKLHWAGLVSLVVMSIPLSFFLYFNKMSYGNPFQLAGTATSASTLLKAAKADVADVATQQLNENEASASAATAAPTHARNALSFFDTRQLPTGLYEHFLSLDRGMIVYAPVMIIGFLGLLFLGQTNPAVANLLGGIIGADVLLYSMWGDPYGGWAFGSRYLIPTYAILAILLALVLTKFRKYALVLVAILLIGSYAVAVNTIGAVTSDRNPPKVEVLGLEALSHVQERYTFTRNMQLLNHDESKSFVYQTYLANRYTAWQFTDAIVGLISLVLLLNFISLYLHRKQT